MDKNVRLKDVAKRAGVGVGTASRVLNNHPYVSDEKRAAVLKAVEELSYRPNAIARSLKTQSTRTIGVIIMDISNPFYSNVVKGIEDTAYKLGYSIILADLSWKDEELVHWIKSYKDKNVDGIIYMGTSITEEILKEFTGENIPVTFLSAELLFDKGKYRNKFAAANINNELAAYMATKYLIEKGYDTLGFIGGMEDDASSCIPRSIGFSKAVEETGSISHPEWQQYGDYSYESGYQAMEEILVLRDKPRAVFAFCDQMAMGAMRATMEHAYKVPQDIAFMGFDGITPGAYYYPSITTVKQPRFTMGKVGVELMVDLIEKKCVEESFVDLPFEIITRESS